jgi:hypothetical protein
MLESGIGSLDSMPVARGSDIGFHSLVAFGRLCSFRPGSSLSGMVLCHSETTWYWVPQAAVAFSLHCSRSMHSMRNWRRSTPRSSGGVEASLVTGVAQANDSQAAERTPRHARSRRCRLPSRVRLNSRILPPTVGLRPAGKAVEKEALQIGAAARRSFESRDFGDAGGGTDVGPSVVIRPTTLARSSTAVTSGTLWAGMLCNTSLAYW